MYFDYRKFKEFRKKLGIDSHKVILWRKNHAHNVIKIGFNEYRDDEIVEYIWDGKEIEECLTEEKPTPLEEGE